MKRALLLGGLVSVAFFASCDRFRTQIPIANSFSKAGEASAECDRLHKQPITLEEEVAVGDAVAVPLVQRAGGLHVDLKGGNTPKNELTGYLNRVGKNLAAQSSRPELEWSFGVLDNPGVNAFATPGGRVFVTRGLLNQLSSEAELAGVLSHEIAHVVNQHGVKSYRRIKHDACKRAAVGQVTDSMLSSVKSNISSSMGEILKPEAAGFVDMNLNQHHDLLRALASDFAEDLTSRGYDAKDEEIADYDGVQLAMAAGYNPHPFIELLGKLPTGKGAIDHHPAAKDRQEKLRRLVTHLTRPSESKDGFPGAFAGIDPATLPTLPLKDQLAAAK